MRSHIRGHMNSQFLTVLELRALRKQLKLLKSVAGNKGPSSTTACQSNHPHPSSSSSSDSSDSDSSDSAESEDRVNHRAPTYDQERSTNFNRTLVRFRIRPAAAEAQDMMGLFSNRRQQLTDNIENEMERFKRNKKERFKRAVKWYVCVKVEMTKYSASGEVKDHASPTFRSASQTVTLPEEKPSQIDAAYFKVCDSLERFKAD